MMTSARPDVGTENITELFTGKILKVPDYQRAYAWDKKNWEDCWNDIVDGIDTKTPHYWGTITLQKTGTQVYVREAAQTFDEYHVVDGQQRLATMYLFLIALNRAGKSALKSSFLKCGEKYRLELGPLNQSFLASLVDDAEVPADMRTNRLLRDALIFFEGQIQAFTKLRDDAVDTLTEYLQANTFALEFKVTDENMAIKAFESLNDRGKPLTLLDKSKSFLMFFSSNYLHGSANGVINVDFGEVFRAYDRIREKSKELCVDYITNPRYRFSEDETLRFFYHYFAQYAANKFGLGDMGYHYDITTEGVFEDFLKPSCLKLKTEPERLSEFVRELTTDFKLFVSDLEWLILQAEHESPYRRLLSFLGASASIYPLMITLKREGLMTADMAELIEALDLRVYKVRGTDPHSYLYREVISRVKLDPDLDKIRAGIIKFAIQFSRDAEFQAALERDMYPNPATKYILWEYGCSQVQMAERDHRFYNTLQKEHVFAQDTTKGFPSSGFLDAVEYEGNIDRLGNLLLLEGDINDRIKNKTPENKVHFYEDSRFPETKQKGYEISTGGFFKSSIDRRTAEIAKFCLSRWRL
jgi:hypothetical protein